MVAHASLSNFSWLFGSKPCLSCCVSHFSIGSLKQANEAILLQILGPLLAILKHIRAFCLNKKKIINNVIPVNQSNPTQGFCLQIIS